MDIKNFLDNRLKRFYSGRFREEYLLGLRRMVVRVSKDARKHLVFQTIPKVYCDYETGLLTGYLLWTHSET